jgi:hypothetical protein
MSKRDAVKWLSEALSHPLRQWTGQCAVIAFILCLQLWLLDEWPSVISNSYRVDFENGLPSAPLRNLPTFGYPF